MLLLVVLTVCGARGQSVDAYGIKGGLAYSTHARDMDAFMAEDHLRRGLTIGGFARWHVGSVVFLSAELLYTQRGYSERYFVTPDPWWWSAPREPVAPRADYLSIPFLAAARLGSRGTPPYLLLGPRLDILVRSEGFSDLNRYILGVTGGLGVQFSIAGSPQLLLEARMSGGLTDAGRQSERTFWSYELLTGIVL